jgi:hypothetical protein
MNRKYGLIFRVIFIMGSLAACSAFPATSFPIPSELGIEEHALTQRPEAEYERLYFIDGTQEQVLAKNAVERSQIISMMDRSCNIDNHFGQCTKLGTDQLAAWPDDPSSPFAPVKVNVFRNGSPIYQIRVGNSSPIESLRGLWSFGDHWALETAYVTNRQQSNQIDSQATGQVSIDGVLLNKKFGYQEAFGFQTMHGKPFYFFKRGGRVGISYSEVEIPLGYAEVPHYGCCSAATLNPRAARNMVAFFARKGSTWYYVEIGVFGLPIP